MATWSVETYLLTKPDIGCDAMIRGLLLDLGGVVFVGEEPIPGAVDAVNRLKTNGIAVRFITNTTRQPLRELLGKMRKLGVSATASEIFMPAIAARQYLRDQKLTPYLLVHPSLIEDFDSPSSPNATAVVVGDAGENFSYSTLNKAYRYINSGAQFLALAGNRSFRDTDGELSLDAGPFVAALEYASGQTAVLLGKPAPTFFRQALASIGLPPTEVVMIGDDVEADIGAAMVVGLSGLLVRTGKYEAGDELKVTPQPTAVVANMSEAADWILTENRQRTD